ncbi:MAG: hypothetical protein HOY69_32565 [Streptomyces sp.]|nr:hypothetical protein [Streptomyces sp.]
MCVASVLWLLALLTESRHSPWRSLLVLWVVGFVAGTAVFALLPRRDTGDRSG